MKPGTGHDGGYIRPTNSDLGASANCAGNFSFAGVSRFPKDAAK
jgi:hypothetical protein